MDELNLDDVQLRYLGLLIDQGYKLKWRFELFGKDFVWLVSPSGQWFAEPLPKLDEEDA